MSAAKIHTAIIAVMRDIEAVGKAGKSTQGYKFRGIDQVYNALHPLLSKHGIVTIPKVTTCKTEMAGETKNGAKQFRVEMLVEYTFLADDGSMVTAGPVAAEGIDSSDKATNKAMSFAHKYVLLQMFCIPTEDMVDGDRDHETVTAQRSSEDKWDELQGGAQQAQMPAGPRLVKPAQPAAQAQTQTLVDVASMLANFGQLGINRPAIEARLGHSVDACTEDDVVFLQKAWLDIKNQRADASQHFPALQKGPPRGRAQALSEKYKNKQPAKDGRH